jgi:hypothetical protein
MKLAALMLLSSLFSALDPNGCGGAIGSNTASSTDGGTSGTNDRADSGALATKSCGALGNHFFCDDFSDGALPGAWDLQSTSAGSLAFDSDVAVSAPRSLLSLTTGPQGATRTYARLEKSFKESARRMTLSYSEWLDPACVGPNDGVEGAGVGIDLYFLGIRHGNPDHIVETSLVNGVYVQGHNLKTSMPRGTWTRITFDVDLVERTMDLTVDGTKIVENEPLKYASGNARPPKIWVGALTDNITGKPAACKLRIDDVAFDIEQ